jgi:predicted ATPase
MPYLPVLDVLKEYFGIDEGDRESAIKKKIRERLRELDEKVETVPPALHEVLSLKVEDDKYPELGPQQRRERTFEAIRDLLIRESQRKPLLLAIEDLHWIDRTSQEFLDYLIGFLPTARILLVLLYRPEFTHAGGSKSYCSGIGVDQLSAQRSAELVQAILQGGEVGPEIAGLVPGKAGGNPLFVEEPTHSLLENGSIQRKDHKFVLTRKPSEIEVPDTIQGDHCGPYGQDRGES